ncbi:MAG: transglycosylase domain-containing protein [Actinomycetota bacterium]|nr:transglycosylase domain-containing protein [Actinomycetota bacterium]
MRRAKNPSIPRIPWSARVTVIRARHDPMSARLERQRRRRRRGGAGRVIIITVAVLVAAAIIAVLSAVGYVVGIANSAPDVRTLKPLDPGRNSIVYAADGKRLGIIQNDVLSTPIQSSKIPKSIRDATVAIEDKRFYEHKGVDPESIVRAAIKNVNSGKTVQGGSTLTMQLIRTLYVPGSGKERTLKRKIREARLAEELENIHPGRRGKDWILTKYLNSVGYGTNDGQTAVGIEAAARVYFSKHADDLTLAQSALLAGLPQAPSDYNPFKNPAQAAARRNDVLNTMADQGFITDSVAREAQGEDLGVKPTKYFQRKRESYFFDYVIDELIKEYGVKTVRGGGLKVTTSIDLDLQRKARAAIAKDLSFGGAPSSAIVSIDPKNGYIRAMASSAKYAQSKFNLAANAKRQPGSAFKVMALVAAVDQGVDPKTTYIQSGKLTVTDPRWGPINVNCYGGSCRGGSLSLVQGTLASDNTVYTRLALDIGPETVKKAARGLGIKSRLEGYPAETLGGLARCCTPLEMANAYATIVSGGWRNKPKGITEVRFPNGKVDKLGKPQRHKQFNSGAMHEVVKILEQNIKSGTGKRAATGCPAAGKTGTTDANRNAWFVGFSPKLATAVWVGFPKANIPMPNLFHGGPVDGGTFPAEIWGIYMKSARRGFCGQFDKPDEVFGGSPLSGRHARSGPRDFGGGVGPSTGRRTKPPPLNNAPPGATPPPTGGYDPDLYDSAPQDEAPPYDPDDNGGGPIDPNGGTPP